MRLLPILALLLLLFAPEEPLKPNEPKALKFGLLVSTTGALADFGTDVKQGVDLAAKQFNEKAGNDGRQIEIVFRDVESSAERARSAAKELAKEDVIACIGCVASGFTIAAAPVFQEAGIPFISPSATNPTVTQQGDMIFRACFMDDFQGWGLACYAWHDMKAKKAGILHVKDDSYTTVLMEAFKAKFEELGGSVIATEAYETDATDFGVQVAAIEAAAPDALFLPGYYNQVALIAREIAESDLEVKLLGCDGWDSPSLLAVAGKALEGALFSNHYCEAASDRAAEFAKAYQSAHKEAPTSLAALGFDTLNMLVACVEAPGADVDSASIAAKLRKLSAFDGVTGTGVRINENRNAEKPLIMVRIKGDAFEFDREVKFSEVQAPKTK
jgi:branched-chain amino acid transport system substrate-binding protein